MQGRKRNGTGKVSDDVQVRGREATNSIRILERQAYISRLRDGVS
jgi:hypothetical protein